ncbi:MAG: AsmA family protein [Pseudomonadota bacterium]
MKPQTRKRLRIAAWPLGILSVLVVGVVVCELIGWPFLKSPLQNTLTQRLERPVEFGGQFKLKLFGSIRLDTSAFRIGPHNDLPAESPLGGDLVKAGIVHLEIPYSTVWQAMRKQSQQQPLRITSLRFSEIDAVLKRTADGRANWIFTKPTPEETKQPTPLPIVDELVVERGHLIFDDAILKTALDANVSTHEGAQAGRGNASSGLLVQGQGQREERPFEFHITSSGVLPLVARDASSVVPITIRLSSGESKFSFDGSGADLLSFQAISGEATLSGLSLAKVGDVLGLTLPTTEAFTLKGRLSKAGQVWSLRQAVLGVGDSHLGGDFTVDRRPEVPLLTGELTGSRLILADLLPAFGVARPGTGNPKPPSGQVVPEKEFDIPSLRTMDADVKVRLQRADLGNLFRQPLAPLEGDLSLKTGVLRLTNVLARAAGGEVSGSLGLDGTQDNPLWTVDLRWAGIELEQWLRPRNTTSQSTKPSGEKPGYVSGKLGGHAKLEARGKSTQKMIASTDGTVQAWVRDGTISHLVIEAVGLDIAQGLGLLVVGDNPLPMYCAVMKVDAQDGKLTPEAAIIDTKDSTLFIEGSVSLADEQLALKVTSKPKDISPATLRSPLRVEGSFAKPKLALEKKPIAGKVLAAIALGVIHPLAALIPLFDAGDNDAAGGCQRALRQLRDADGPATARASQAPKASDKNLPAENAPAPTTKK